MSDLPVAPGSYPENATNTLGLTDERSEVGYFLRRTPGRAARLASDIHRLRISVLLYGDRVQPRGGSAVDFSRHVAADAGKHDFTHHSHRRRCACD